MLSLLRTSILASGALILAIGIIVLAFVAGTTRNADAQYPRTNGAWMQPRASNYYWAAQNGTFGAVPTTVKAVCQTGYRVDSGGFRSYAGSEQLDIYISAPADVDRGWEIRGKSSGSTAILVYAHCVSP